MDNSLATRTLSQYERGFSSYKNFLIMSGLIWDNNLEKPPLSEETLIHYATHCHKMLNIKCSTIKLYICGICYKYLRSGSQSLFSSSCSLKLYRLEAIYKGIIKSENKNVRERFPITYTMLAKMCSFLQKGVFSPYTYVLIETSSIVAYFGF